jgi:hypothetical protein
LSVRCIFETACNYGNAQPVKSKRLVGDARSWSKTGTVFNIDYPIRPINSALSLYGWLQK